MYQVKSLLKYNKKMSYLFLIIIMFGFFYVANTWSPSSYGIFLTKIGAPNIGLILGQPNENRSDEWGIYTPQVQATINNHFQRYNKTSYYNEDLRFVMSLPLHDWGMIFKFPQWGFLTLEPAYAYSLQWYIYFALFFIGYSLFFYTYNIANEFTAILMTTLLYFSGFIQSWWTISVQTIAIFPWFMLSLTECHFKNDFLRVLLIYWISTTWCLSFFYPPYIISLVFCGFILILAFKRHIITRRWLSLLGIAGFLSLLTTYLYLHDYLLGEWNTIYPGQRSVNGGSVSFRDILSTFIPGINIFKNNNLIGPNFCEISTVGNYFSLFLLFFFDYKKICHKLSADFKNRVFSPEIILLIGVIILYAWVLLPIPKEIGKIILFDRIPAARMKLAAGLLSLITLFYFYKIYGVKNSATKWLAMSIVVTIAFIHYKLNLFFYPPLFLINDSTEIIFIFFCIIMYSAHKIGLIKNNNNIVYACMCIALIIQMILFGLFNPIQSTKLIFNIPKTTIVENLKQTYNKYGFLEEPGYFAATLNGLGFKSVSHVLYVPRLSYWQRRFPGLNKKQLDYLFNRYEFIGVSDKIKRPIPYTDHGVIIPRRKYPDVILKTSS